MDRKPNIQNIPIRTDEAKAIRDAVFYSSASVRVFLDGKELQMLDGDPWPAIEPIEPGPDWDAYARRIREMQAELGAAAGRATERFRVRLDALEVTRHPNRAERRKAARMKRKRK